MSICQIYDLCADTLWLGRYGENGARDIAIDVGRWFADLGAEGTVVLVNWRPGEDDTPYNSNITMDGSKVVWSPSSIDLAISGRGFAELRYYVGNVLAKSKTFRTVIDRTPSEGANPPSAAEDWLERMEDAAVTAQTASETAVDAAETATEGAQAVAQALPTVTQAAGTATNAATEAAASKEVASVAANAAQTASETATAASQTAVSSATTATTKAAQAVEAAGTATTKASEATQAATTAIANAQTSTAKATEATTAAATATSKATEATTAAATASAAATTATGAASTATSAASTATSAASTATAAKTAAQTAQTRAETARAAAEAAAASVSASAAQIATNTADIGVLKADLNNIIIIGEPLNPTYVSGYITTSGAIGNGEVRTNFIKLHGQYVTVVPKESRSRIAEYSGTTAGTFTKFIAKDRITSPITFAPDPNKYYVIDASPESGGSYTPETCPVDALTIISINNTDTSLSLSGKPADAKAVGDRFTTETAKTALNIRSQQRPNVLFDMQAGHGFYNPLGAGNAPEDDTEDFINGNQSVFFNHAGQSSFSALNLSEMVLHVKLKVDTITSGASIVMYISDVSSMASCKIYTLYKSEPSNQFETGIWADVSVYADAGRIVGTPDLTKAKYIRFSVSNGSATYHIQSIGYRYAGKQKPCISFTFDDGWSEAMLGAKILGKYNIPATAYIFEGCQLTTEQLQSLKNNYGWDIELHSDSVFTEKTPSEIAEELQSLKNYIQNNGLGDGNHLAYAGGQNNINVVNAVRKFCKTARTVSMESSYNETVPPSMPYNLRAVTGVGASGQSVANVKRYIDKTVERNAWLILVFHRIGDTATSMFCSEADLDAIAQYAAASGADIKTVADMWERN